MSSLFPVVQEQKRTGSSTVKNKVCTAHQIESADVHHFTVAAKI